MPTDLEQKAKDALPPIQAEIEAINGRVERLRDDVDRKFVELPAKKRTDLTREELFEECGAREHLELARDLLIANRAEQVEIRVALGAVANPADAPAHEVALRQSLVEGAKLRVEVREAEERLAAASTTLTLLGELIGAATERRHAIERRIVWASTRAVRVGALRASIPATTSDGTSVHVAATDGRGANTWSDADRRLGDLLPAELRQRAAERRAEAVKYQDDAMEHLNHLAELERAHVERTTPMASIVNHRIADVDVSEAALAAHVSGSADRVAWALAALGTVTAHPDLSPTQHEALDAADRADAVTAAGTEKDLADALAVVAEAERSVERERIAALADDPSATADSVAAWGDAQDEAASGAVIDPLEDARTANTPALRDALDAWEVEVPESLWEALAAFGAATSTLDQLAPAAYETALVTELDDAEAAVLDAWNEVDAVRWSARLLALERSDRQTASESVPSNAAQRELQFLRGDATGGRTRRELQTEPDLEDGA